jgi:hypothetical protein
MDEIDAVLKFENQTSYYDVTVVICHEELAKRY